MEYITEKFNENPRRFPKGNIVLFQGEIPRSGFVVISGTLKVYAIDNNGNDKVVGFLIKGDVFPLDWLSGSSKSAVFYVETLTETELAPLSKAAFIEKCLPDPEFMRQHAAKLQKETTASLVRNLALQQSLAANKILYLFYYFAISYGREIMPGLYNLGLPLTHQLIADCLGLTRETVAAELNKLKKVNAIVYRQQQYIVDKKLLTRAVGKEISENFN